MAIKTYRPTTPSRRHMSVSGFDGVEKHVRPEKSLVEVLKKNAGRNSYGHITVRHQGGGNRQKYRVIDFKRDKREVEGKVLRLEYDPNRSAYIALVEYADGERRYILAPVGLGAGDAVMASAAADIKPGNALPMANIPVGTVIHNIELYPGKGAQLVRSAGVAAQLMAKENGDAQGPHGLLCHHRPGRQHRPRQCPHRQGRPQTPHGLASHCPRFCHEPC